MRQMKKSFRSIALVTCMILLLSVFAGIPVRADTGENENIILYDLKTDALENPVGIDNTAPQFSWKMQSDQTGQRQTAYQIVVSKDTDFSDIVWDSGKVTDSSSVWIAYEGAPLTSSTAYYWKVSVWDKDENITVSDTASFEMGLLEENAWDGSSWIQVQDYTALDDFHYTVEADIKIQNGAVGILFSALDDKNCYMWQFNITTGQLRLVPHMWKNGAYSLYTPAAISNVSIDSIKNEFIPVLMDVTPGEIKTYVDGELVHTFVQGTPSTNGVEGLDPIMGQIGLRTSASEIASCSKLMMTDYTTSEAGEVIYEYNFDYNPFAVGSIANGVYNVEETTAHFVIAPRNASAMRKTFRAKAGLTSAKLYTTGLGVYNAFINGRRVGTLQEDGNTLYDELKPGYTETLVRKFYHSYDVTHLIDADRDNAISAIVTNGWWGDDVVRFFGKRSAFRAKLILTYANGAQEVIATDTSWTGAFAAPVKYADIYTGEIYDATVSTDFMLPGFDDSSWAKAQVNTEFKGEICAQADTPVRVRQDLERSVQSVTVYEQIENATATQYGNIVVKAMYGDEPFTIEPGEIAVVDFGQNFAGWEAFSVEGNRGTLLKIRHAEVLNESDGIMTRGNDGPEGSILTRNLRKASAVSLYRLSGNGVETWHPSYSYFGFRYIEITASETVTIHQIKGQVVTSVAKDNGTLHTSDPAVNQLISNVQWGLYSNYLSVPTDCPQRDERAGWTADTHVFANTAAYYTESTKNFLRKFLQDMRDSQQADGRYYSAVPRNKYGNNLGAMGWSEAGIIVPYNLYQIYADKSLIEEHYESMKRYMDVFMASTNKMGGDKRYGDWLAIEANDDALKNLLGVAYYAWDAKMMSEMAQVLGHHEDANRYQALYEDQKAYFQELYVNPDGSLTDGRQTACLFALKVDLLPDQQSAEKVTAQLLENISSKGYKVQTGFLGTSVLLPTITQFGLEDAAYKLLLQHESPSWLSAVDNGATTIWERWDTYTKETGYKTSSMSFNHYAYGVAVEWMYSHMAGIQANPEVPGFQHIILSPTPNQQLSFAGGSYDSVYGTIESKWNYEGDRWNYHASIPANTEATVLIPADDESVVLVNGKAYDLVNLEDDGIVFNRKENGKYVFNAVSGSFDISASINSVHYISIRNLSTNMPGAKVKINGGNAQELPPSIEVNNGDTITLEVIPLNVVDYRLASWSGDIESSNNPLTITPENSMNLEFTLEYCGYPSIAVGAPVTATQANASSWKAANLTDGYTNHMNAQGVLGWSSANQGLDAVFAKPATAVINLGSAQEVNRFHLYPRTDLFRDGQTVNFPVDYTISVSDDNQEWTEVYAENDQEIPYWSPVVIELEESVSAQYIKLTVNSVNQSTGSGVAHYVQLCELGVYNIHAAVTPPDKDALEQLIALAEEKEEADYTAESWSGFADALSAAQAVLADENADQDAVNGAYDDLDAAMKALVKVDGGEEILVTKIKINASGLFTLSVKKEAQIPVTVEPEDATDPSVKWISTNTNIFTVDADGNITPHKQGTATLTAQSSNGLKSTIIVRITA